jgi:hypothetical protein
MDLGLVRRRLMGIASRAESASIAGRVGPDPMHRSNKWYQSRRSEKPRKTSPGSHGDGGACERLWMVTRVVVTGELNSGLG